MKVLQLLLPISAFEFQKKCADNIRGIKRRIEKVPNIRRRHALAGLGRVLIFFRATGRTATPAGTAPAAGDRTVLQVLARGFALGSVQPVVAIFIELFEYLDLLAHHTRTSRRPARREIARAERRWAIQSRPSPWRWKIIVRSLCKRGRDADG